MESEVEQAAPGLESPLAEPHFDDEATLLSARRVVPLDEAGPYEPRTTSHPTRGWMWAATIVGAMLLGVVIGAGYYSLAHRESINPALEQEITSGVDAISSEPGNPGDSAAAAPASTDPAGISPVDQTDAPVTPPQPTVSSNQSKKPVARRVDVLTSAAKLDEKQDREERRARKEAKRRIRELERESRSRNDLTHIREIFEGPQKP